MCTWKQSPQKELKNLIQFRLLKQLVNLNLCECPVINLTRISAYVKKKKLN